MDDWTTTLAAMGLAAIVLAIAFWRDHRPKTDSLRVRWMPWRFIMLLAGTVILYGFVHVLTLAGLRPTQPAPRY